MCRILGIKIKNTKNNKPENILETLEQFTDMCKKSRTLDGDWQGDGFGITWLDNQNNWQEVKSTNPIWQEMKLFTNFQTINKISQSNIVLAHARSATFKNQMQQNDTSYNQPYHYKNLAFAFNGHLKGVKFKKPIPGKIGAEKIWNILLEIYSTQHKIKSSLEQLDTVMKENVENILGMNILFSDSKNIGAICRFTPNTINPTYHNLWTYMNDNEKVICSEQLPKYNTSKKTMTKVENSSILTL